jgi:hypothetical protein
MACLQCLPLDRHPLALRERMRVEEAVEGRRAEGLCGEF